MTLTPIREALLDALTLPPDVFRASEEASLRLHQSELASAAKFGMWKSVTLLAGQMIEACLAKRLADHPNIPTRATFGQLIYAAKSSGVLPGYDSPVLGIESISTALIIRNWAAHFTAWSQYPTELRAMQAIALTLCAVESLFPNPQRRSTVPTGDNQTEWRVHPRTIVKRLEGLTLFDPLPDPLAVAQGDVFDHIARIGSLRTVARLGHEVRRLKLSLDAWRTTLATHLGYLAIHAAHANDKFLLRIVLLLRNCGLPDHARVFGVLLPFDAHILTHLLRTRHPLQVTFYVQESHRAEPSLFSWGAPRHDVGDQLVPTFWRELAAGTDKLSVITRTLQPMPVLLLAQLMTAAPVAMLAERIHQSPPKVAVKLLYAVRDSIVKREPKLTGVRDALVAALNANIATASLETLHNVPVFFAYANMRNDVVTLRITRTLLARVCHATPTSAEEWSAIRRVVWDTFLYIPNVAADALGVAHTLLVRFGERNWSLLCLRGMAELARSPGSPHFNDAHDQARNIGIPADADRWQIYLALVAAHAMKRESADLPSSLIDTAKACYERPAKDAPRISHQLVDRVAAILAKL